MNLFQTVKAAVSPRDAAEAYGLTVSRNGMTCCPFHEDRHPSLKLNEDYFFCFGCGASGDVIDFTARIYGLSNVQAPRLRRCPSNTPASGRTSPAWTSCAAAGP